MWDKSNGCRTYSIWCVRLTDCKMLTNVFSVLLRTRKVRSGSLGVHIEVFGAVSSTDGGLWLQGLIIWCPWLQSQHLKRQFLSAESDIVHINAEHKLTDCYHVNCWCCFSRYKLSLTRCVIICNVYFSFCRLSICSVSTLSSCCMAACWCSEISGKESARSSSLSSFTTSATEGSRGLTGGEGVL